MPRRSRRLRGRARRLRRAGPALRGDLPRRQPRPRRPRRAPARGVLARRGARGAVDPGRDHARDPRSTSTSSSRPTSRSTSGCSTPAPGIRSGSTCCRRCRPSCASTRRRHRVCLIGHSHVALSFSRGRRWVRQRPDAGRRRAARPDRRRVADQPRERRPAARRRPSRRLARARPRRVGGASTGARSTTSREPPPRSARLGCPIRWPSASPTVSKKPLNRTNAQGRSPRLTESQRGDPLESGRGCAMRLAPSSPAGSASPFRASPPAAAAPACSRATSRSR